MFGFEFGNGEPERFFLSEGMGLGCFSLGLGLGFGFRRSDFGGLSVCESLCFGGSLFGVCLLFCQTRGFLLRERDGFGFCRCGFRGFFVGDGFCNRSRFFRCGLFFGC